VEALPTKILDDLDTPGRGLSHYQPLERGTIYAVLWEKYVFHLGSGDHRRRLEVQYRTSYPASLCCTFEVGDLVSPGLIWIDESALR
jgi:hypothetical protein